MLILNGHVVLPTAGVNSASIGPSFDPIPIPEAVRKVANIPARSAVIGGNVYKSVSVDELVASAGTTGPCENAFPVFQTIPK